MLFRSKDAEKANKNYEAFDDGEQVKVWNSLNDGSLDELTNVQKQLTKLRDNSIAGAGGAVPSYGENQLCNFANELRDDGGFESYYNKHEQFIGVFRKELTQKLQNPANKNEAKQNNKLLQDTADALGMDKGKDFNYIVNYIAARNHYGQIGRAHV